MLLLCAQGITERLARTRNIVVVVVFCFAPFKTFVKILIFCHFLFQIRFLIVSPVLGFRTIFILSIA